MVSGNLGILKHNITRRAGANGIFSLVEAKVYAVGVYSEANEPADKLAILGGGSLCGADPGPLIHLGFRGIKASWRRPCRHHLSLFRVKGGRRRTGPRRERRYRIRPHDLGSGRVYRVHPRHRRRFITSLHRMRFLRIKRVAHKHKGITKASDLLQSFMHLAPHERKGYWPGHLPWILYDSLLTFCRAYVPSAPEMDSLQTSSQAPEHPRAEPTFVWCGVFSSSGVGQLS